MELKWKKYRKEQVLMSEALARQISNGVPILDSLTALSDGFLDYRDTWRNVKKGVEEGNNISQYLDQQGDAFHPLLIEAVKVGEALGVLDVMLEIAAEVIEKEMQLEKKGYSAADVNELMFYHQLWFFTKHGKSVDEQKNMFSALGILSQSSETLPQEVWQSLHEQVARGSSLYAAMADFPDYFSKSARELIHAGNSNLSLALAAAAKFKEESLDHSLTPEMLFYNVLHLATEWYFKQTIAPEVEEIVTVLNARVGENTKEGLANIEAILERGIADDESDDVGDIQNLPGKTGEYLRTVERANIMDENVREKSQEERDREIESSKREYLRGVTLPSLKLAAKVSNYLPLDVLGDIITHLEDKEKPFLLGEAMRKHPRYFSPVIVNLLSASENYQSINNGARAVLRYLQMERRLSEKCRD